VFEMHILHFFPFKSTGMTCKHVAAAAAACDKNSNKNYIATPSKKAFVCWQTFNLCCGCRMLFILRKRKCALICSSKQAMQLPASVTHATAIGARFTFKKVHF